jgi:hypothetical protein
VKVVAMEQLPRSYCLLLCSSPPALASAEAADMDMFVQAATRWFGRPNRRSIG